MFVPTGASGISIGRGSAEHVSFHDVWSFGKRNARLLALCTALGIAIGTAYVLKTPARYLAVARLVMDPGQERIASQETSSGTIIIEAAEIASQVEIVKSEAVARAVITELDLLNDPELRTSVSWRARVLSAWTFLEEALGLADGSAVTPPDDDLLLRQTMAHFLSRVLVRRVGQSYVLEIGYMSTDPERAAVTANAIARTYIRAGLEERRRVAKSGAQWLEGRLVEIATLAREAQLKEERYRLETGITAVGATSSLEEQQLIETSRQLLAAQTETSGQRARLETVVTLLKDPANAIATEDAALEGPMGRLRDEIRIADARLTTLLSRYGPDNVTVRTAREEVQRLTDDMRTALRRIVAAYRTSLATAQAKERLLLEELGSMKARDADNDVARVELAELASRTATYRRMYESMLQRLISALERQSFPLGTARMVTAATRPLAKSTPRTSLILPFSAIAGFSLGLLVAGWRVGMDRKLRPDARSNLSLNVPTLGVLPTYRTASIGWRRKSRAAPRLSRKADTRLRKLRAVLDAPYGPFVEALRGVRARIDMRLPATEGAVIAITSMLPQEGRTTVAANLAQLYRNEGFETVLIDADFDTGVLFELDPELAAFCGLSPRCIEDGDTASPVSASLPRDLVAQTVDAEAPSPADSSCVEGEVLERPAPDLIEDESETFLPGLALQGSRRSARPGHLFAHLTMLEARLAELRRSHRRVIVDVAAFPASADARAVCAMADAVVLVTREPSTMSTDEVAAAMDQLGPARSCLAGILFNRCPAPNGTSAAISRELRA